MEKKGFTLVELLAVIVLLGIISTVAVTSYTRITKNMKNSMLEEKVKIVEEAAILKGQDLKGYIIESNLKYKIKGNSYPCRSFIVSDLVPTYLDKDNNNECLSAISTGTLGCVKDPSNDNNYLDKYEVIIYYKNKRIYAKVDINDELICR